MSTRDTGTTGFLNCCLDSFLVGCHGGYNVNKFIGQQVCVIDNDRGNAFTDGEGVFSGFKFVQLRSLEALQDVAANTFGLGSE